MPLVNIEERDSSSIRATCPALTLIPAHGPAHSPHRAVTNRLQNTSKTNPAVANENVPKLTLPSYEERAAPIGAMINQSRIREIALNFKVAHLATTRKRRRKINLQDMNHFLMKMQLTLAK